MLIGILVGLAAVFLVGVMTAPRRWAQLYGVALAVPIAVLTYGMLGIGIAQTLGVGRFYSVPFGAERIRDWHIVASLAVWTCIWSGVILWLLRKNRPPIPSAARQDI